MLAYQVVHYESGVKADGKAGLAELIRASDLHDPCCSLGRIIELRFFVKLDL